MSGWYPEHWFKEVNWFTGVIVVLLLIGYVLAYGIVAYWLLEHIIYRVTGLVNGKATHRVNRWTGTNQRLQDGKWVDTGLFSDHYILRFILDPLSYHVERTNKNGISEEEYRRKGGRKQ